MKKSKTRSIIKSDCICSKNAKFTVVIDYKMGIFKQYSGIVIGKCKNCGLLKTLVLNGKFNAQESQGGFYENNKIIFEEIFKRLIDEIYKYKPEGRVLDVGCSSGVLMEVLARYGYEVYGIEPNKSAFKYARRKFLSHVFNKTSNVYFKNSHKKFDIIIYNHVLEHIPDINLEFVNIKKNLKKNGLLVISVPNTDNFVYLFRGERWESLMPKEHIWHFNKNYLIKLISKKGFLIEKYFFSNQSRKDYPFYKRLYFLCLNLLNVFFEKGEAITLIATLK